MTIKTEFWQFCVNLARKVKLKSTQQHVDRQLIYAKIKLNDPIDGSMQSPATAEQTAPHPDQLPPPDLGIILLLPPSSGAIDLEPMRSE